MNYTIMNHTNMNNSHINNSNITTTIMNYSSFNNTIMNITNCTTAQLSNVVLDNWAPIPTDFRSYSDLVCTRISCHVMYAPGE